MKFFTVAFALLAAVGAFSPVQGEKIVNGAPRGCPFDHSPCECIDDGTGIGYEITCVNVTAEQVQSMFNKSDRFEIYQLTLEGSFYSLPADLLAGRRVRTIDLTFHKPTPGLIDVDVFRSSQDYTAFISMKSSEQTALNMTFLSQFSALEVLFLTGQWSSFKSMPQLPSLKQIYTNSPGYQDLLDAHSSYQETLEKLSITGVNLRQIPAEISSLSRLYDLDLSFNQFTVLPPGFINISANLTYLGLTRANVQVVEPGAFQGDFSRARINLGYHQMDKLDELAFRDVLQSMEDAKSDGYIYLSSDHSFVCDCHLSWLLVTNRHLLSRVQFAYCREPETGQTISLDNYDANNLATCAGGTVAPTTTTTTTPQTFGPTVNKSSRLSSVAGLLVLLFISHSVLSLFA